jgi:hypothetical protein
MDFFNFGGGKLPGGPPNDNLFLDQVGNSKVGGGGEKEEVQ